MHGAGWAVHGGPGTGHEAERERGRGARTVHRLGVRAPPAAGVGSRLPARTARFQSGFHSEKWKRAAVFIWKVSEWFQTKVEARRSFQLLTPRDPKH